MGLLGLQTLPHLGGPEAEHVLGLLKVIYLALRLVDLLLLPGKRVPEIFQFLLKLVDDGLLLPLHLHHPANLHLLLLLALLVGVDLTLHGLVVVFDAVLLRS